MILLRTRAHQHRIRSTVACALQRTNHQAIILASHEPSLATRSFAALSTTASSNTYNENNQYLKVLLTTSCILGISSIAAYEKQRAECCGIAGVVGSAKSKNSDAREFLLDGLTVMKNRGYDSAGLATISPTTLDLHVTKYASNGDNADGIELVREHSLGSAGHHVGIAHTRWATHGGKTDENAHPHTDSHGKIAVVHNGTINNANQLRKWLIDHGHKFSSQTDTEVISKLIGHYYEAEEGISVRDATEKALKLCDGTWGLGIVCTDTPNEMVVACNGSPLVIGIGTDRTFIASETSAFNRQTKNFIAMKDGEIGVLHADGRSLNLQRVQKAPMQDILLSPDPHPHWTIKE